MVVPSGAAYAAAPSSPRISQSSAEQTQQLARDLVANGFLPKLQGRHISNHGLAERLYLGRHALGQALGLSSSVLDKLTPFPPQPGNNTFIVNDQQPVLEVLAQLVATLAQKPADTPPVPTPPVTPPVTPPPVVTPPVVTPTPDPVTPDPITPIEGAVSSLRQWLWPLIAAAALSGIGGSAWYFWPSAPAPSDVVADFKATIR